MLTRVKVLLDSLVKPEEVILPDEDLDDVEGEKAARGAMVPCALPMTITLSPLYRIDCDRSIRYIYNNSHIYIYIIVYIYPLNHSWAR